MGIRWQENRWALGKEEKEKKQYPFGTEISWVTKNKGEINKEAMGEKKNCFQTTSKKLGVEISNTVSFQAS